MDEQERLRRALADLHPLWGGELCLDFADTVEPRGGPPPYDLPAGYEVRDYLPGYDHLVAWAILAGVLGEAEAPRLVREANRRPAEAAATFARAITLREAIYRAFWAAAHGRSPQPDDLVVISRTHAAGLTHAALVPAEHGYRWEWPDVGPDLDRPIWPVARSAVDLLTAGDLGRVKVCPGVPGDPVACAWLFYDATKNRNRHWCSMDDCGAATKARRRTARRRAARARPLA